MFRGLVDFILYKEKYYFKTPVYVRRTITLKPEVVSLGVLVFIVIMFDIIIGNIQNNKPNCTYSVIEKTQFEGIKTVEKKCEKQLL
jgi:hypothetical protein